MRAVLLISPILAACATGGPPGTPPRATPAAAGPPAKLEPARAVFGSALLERVVRAELPLALPMPGEPATAVQVVDIRYCGLDAAGRARARAVLTPGAPAAGSQAIAALRAPDDCVAPLEALAQRVLPLVAGARPPAVAVAELGAAASASDLALSLERVALAGERAAAGAEGLRALAARPGVLPVPTSAVQVGDPGAKPAAVLSLGFEWRPDGVVLIATPGPRPLAGRAGGRDKSAASDLSIDLPLGFINALVQEVLARGPIRVPLDSEEVALSDVRVAQADGRLLVTGRATPRSVGQSFDVAVDSRAPTCRWRTCRSPPRSRTAPRWAYCSASAATPATPAARAPPRHWPPACANVTAASWYARWLGRRR